MTPSKFYLYIVGVSFVGLSTVMLAFPRSRYSELEKRELAEVPEFSVEKLQDSRYTKELSSWFSDTEPYRDEFMSASMKVRDALKLRVGGHEEAITFHAQADGPAEAVSAAPPKDAPPEQLKDYQNNLTANENAKIGGSGIIVIGSGPNVRALMAFGGASTGGTEFARTVSNYKKQMPGVNVYAMVIPLASEFYTPEKAKKVTRPQRPFIQNIYDHLTDGAKGVNAYNALASHAAEDIYLRTDHHWAPLGAYYAAEEFAKTAKVPFKPLSTYTRQEVKNFVGSMYGYSKDISVKNAPETFVYYTPNGVDYSTTYWIYDTNKSYKVTRERAPIQAPYFSKFKDGSGMAYCTFMGGDQKLTRVKTSTKNGRKLVVIKDSYGNAVPGYLFHSFEEVHVVDFRYFTRNIKKYVKENGITDILFCVNAFNAYSSSTARKMGAFLTQGGGGSSALDVAEPMASTSREERNERRDQKDSSLKADKTESAAKPNKNESAAKPNEVSKTDSSKKQSTPKPTTQKDNANQKAKEPATPKSKEQTPVKTEDQKATKPVKETPPQTPTEPEGNP